MTYLCHNINFLMKLINYVEMNGKTNILILEDELKKGCITMYICIVIHPFNYFTIKNNY